MNIEEISVDNSLTEVPLETLKEKLKNSSYDSGIMVNATIDYLTALYNDEVSIVDATNPAMFLIEANCTSAVNFIDHSNSNLSKRYLSLAVTEEEIFSHLADDDYDNIFSYPGSCTFDVLVQTSLLKSYSIDSDNGKFTYVSIAKDTEVVVNGIPYTFKHEVEIRNYVNGAIKVIYIKNDDDVESFVIDNYVFRDSELVTWLKFSVDLNQMSRSSGDFTTIKSYNFNETISYEGEYKGVKVYNVVNGELKKIQVTYINELYDPQVPFCKVVVGEDSIAVSIPSIYINSSQVNGDIKIVVEATNGNFAYSYENFVSSNFRYTLRNHEYGTTDANLAFSECSAMITTNGLVYGGRSALSLNEVKQMAMDHTLGTNVLPITTKHMAANINESGYDSFRTIDTLTGRLYVMSSDIPVIENSNMYTELDTSFLKLEVVINDIRLLDSVVDNDSQITILPSTLYRMVDNKATILTGSEASALRSMSSVDQVATIDTDNLRKSPFFYNVDYESGILGVNVYQMDNPKLLNRNFYDFNESIPLFMSSGNISMTYSLEDFEYTLVITLKPDSVLSTIPRNQIFGQLFIPYDGVNRYVDIYDVINYSDGRVELYFKIGTNLYIKDNRLTLTNFKNGDGEVEEIDISLIGDISVLYGITNKEADYTTGNLDELITQDSSLPLKYPLTHEKLTIKFGTNLEYIWKDSRILGGGTETEKWERDIPLKHEITSVSYDPLEGDDVIPFSMDDECKVIYTPAYIKGEIVLDEDGEIIYKYRKGDVKLGTNGEVLTQPTEKRNITMDVLTYSGCVAFVSNEDMLSLVSNVNDYIISQSTVDIEPLLKLTLERTTLLYKPKDSLGEVNIEINGNNPTWIEKEQKFDITYYVEEYVFENDELKTKIKNRTIDILSEELKNLTVSYSSCVIALNTELNDLIVSLSIDGFGGESNKALTVSLVDAGDRLSIAKKLSLDVENKVTIEEDISFTWIQHTALDNHNRYR